MKGGQSPEHSSSIPTPANSQGLALGRQRELVLLQAGSHQAMLPPCQSNLEAPRREGAWVLSALPAPWMHKHPPVCDIAGRESNQDTGLLDHRAVSSLGPGQTLLPCRWPTGMGG